MKLFILLFFLATNASASVVVGATRVIFDANKKEAQVSVTNTSKTNPFLVQSWVDNYDDNNQSSVPFTVLPPLFRLDSSAENTVRIVSIKNNLPSDRESIYWLSIKSIPTSDKNAQNQLLISVKTKIKLIWRPESLSTSDANKAYKNINFKRIGDKIQIENPTPYYISFQYINVNNIEIKDVNLIAPKSTLLVKAPQGNSISWSAINDYGAVTKKENKKI